MCVFLKKGFLLLLAITVNHMQFLAMFLFFSTIDIDHDRNACYFLIFGEVTQYFVSYIKIKMIFKINFITLWLVHLFNTLKQCYINFMNMYLLNFDTLISNKPPKKEGFVEQNQLFFVFNS